MNELGRFLADRRARLRPAEIGIPDVGRRRVPGLRREEVATLAGVGVTWYTMLESGRAPNASTDVLRAVARALRLDDVETGYLLRLAKGGEDIESAAVPVELQRILDATMLPAYVIDRRWLARAWNEAFTRLWALQDRRPPLDVVRALFVDEPARNHHGEHLGRNAAPMIGMIRSGLGRRPSDERYRDLEAIFLGDPMFAELWHRYDVSDPRVSSRVVFDVPLGDVSGYHVCNADLPLLGLTIVYQIPE